MSVEHCSSISPSLKAKLQNAGMLWIDDILRPRAEENSTNPTMNRPNLQESESCFSSSSPSLAATTDTLLQRCPQLTRNEAAEVIQALLPYFRSDDPAETNYYIPPDIRTLHDLLEDEKVNKRERVTTFCRSIDLLLGGGVPVGSLTEVCGPPGVGKTQLLMQLAVNCALPKQFGGLDGACLFIDTEGSFIPERFQEIAHAAVMQVRNLTLRQEREGFDSRSAVSVGDEDPQVTSTTRGNDIPCFHSGTSDNNGEDSDALSFPRPSKMGRTESGHVSRGSMANFFSVEHILQQTQYIRLLDVVSLMAVLNVIPTYLASNPKIRMVIIDSIAFPFRSFTQIGNHMLENEALDSGGVGVSARSREFVLQRSRLLFSCGQLLQRHAREQKLCIVVSNQMTSRTVDGEGTESSRVLVPALGDSWAYGLSTRLLLAQQHRSSRSSGAEKYAGSCHENVAFVTGNYGTVPGAGSSVNVVQHRVMHLVKSPTEPRGECCFSVSEKGVRDAFRVSD